MVALSIYCDTIESPAGAASLCEHLLVEARTRIAPLLCAYVLGGDVLALGRYHAVPPPRGTSGVDVARRKSGGRAAPLGDGYLALAIALPHGAALIGDDPGKLAPPQILNRAVRGLLGALESLGVSAHYPGRDLVTVGGRVIAALAFETAADGATLVEACIAVGRSFGEVSRFADRADPGGVVPVDLWLPDQATSIVAAGGRDADLDELTAALAAGYAGRLGLDVTMIEGLPRPAPDPTWVERGRVAAHLDRHAIARDMLGVVEVYAACADGHVAEVRLCGDFIAPSAIVGRIEAALRGAPIDRDELRRRVLQAADERPDALLGVRAVATVADLTYTACAT